MMEDVEVLRVFCQWKVVIEEAERLAQNYVIHAACAGSSPALSFDEVCERIMQATSYALRVAGFDKEVLNYNAKKHMIESNLELAGYKRGEDGIAYDLPEGTLSAQIKIAREEAGKRALSYYTPIKFRSEDRPSFDAMISLLIEQMKEVISLSSGEPIAITDEALELIAVEAMRVRRPWMGRECDDESK